MTFNFLTVTSETRTQCGYLPSKLSVKLKLGEKPFSDIHGQKQLPLISNFSGMYWIIYSIKMGGGILKREWYGMQDIGDPEQKREGRNTKENVKGGPRMIA